MLGDNQFCNTHTTDLGSSQKKSVEKGFIQEDEADKENGTDADKRSWTPKPFGMEPLQTGCAQKGPLKM